MNVNLVSSIVIAVSTAAVLALVWVFGLPGLWLFALLPVGLLLVGHSRLWFTVTLGLFYSGIYFPGFPKSFDLFHAMAAGLALLLAATAMIASPRERNDRGMKWMAAAFLGVMVLTMNQRGVGMAFLGGNLWGGASYLYMGLAFALFFFSDALTLEERQWKHVLVLMFSLGLLPAIAEMVFLLSGGSIVHLFMVIRQGGGVAEGNLDALLGYEAGVFRLKTSKDAIFLLILTLAIFPYEGKYKKWIWGVGALSAILVALSGHRTTVLLLLMLIPLLTYMTHRRFPGRILFFYGLALIAGTVFLALWGRMLPLSVQRAASWIPFADIDYMAKESAIGTWDGRIEMWRILISEYLPKYWLIGKGFAFSTLDLLSVKPWESATVAFMITNNYHNGILVLLINLGIGGLIFGYGFLLLGLRRHYRMLQEPWCSKTLARYHRVMLTFYAILLVEQTAVGCGDWVTQPVIIMVILEGLAITNKHQLAASAAKAGHTKGSS